MRKEFQIVLFFLLFILSALSVHSAISPKGPAQDFSFQNTPSCDFSISNERISAGISNFAHFKGFFLMSLLALFAFNRKQIFGSFLFVFGLTLITESMQMWSLSRHCRLTDAIPNFMGLALAIGLMWVLSKVKSNFQLLKKRKN